MGGGNLFRRTGGVLFGGPFGGQSENHFPRKKNSLTLTLIFRLPFFPWKFHSQRYSLLLAIGIYKTDDEEI